MTVPRCWPRHRLRFTANPADAHELRRTGGPAAGRQGRQRWLDRRRGSSHSVGRWLVTTSPPFQSEPSRLRRLMERRQPSLRSRSGPSGFRGPGACPRRRSCCRRGRMVDFHPSLARSQLAPSVPSPGAPSITARGMTATSGRFSPSSTQGFYTQHEREQPDKPRHDGLSVEATWIWGTRARQIGRQNTPAQETAPAALQLTA
jgi:hypothetical protein